MLMAVKISLVTPGKRSINFFLLKGIQMKPVEITDQNFETEVIKSDKPVLIDFWAVWCGPCKLIAPIVEELANEYDGKVKIGKLDVDSNQETSIKFGVRSIPTLLLFKDGNLKDTIIGAVPKSKIVEKLNAAL